jgi:glucose/arabinose dehydrogenase
MRRHPYNPIWSPAVLLILASIQAPSLWSATLPANFYDSLVNSNANLSNPTAMAIAPDGRIFVCQQGGSLRVIKNGALLTTPFFTIPPATMSSAGERGLLGVAFDPNFTANRYLYIYSTHIQPTGSVTFSGATTVSGPVTYNRVSRLTADAANPDTALAGSESIILNIHPLSGATNHNGGAMHFGADGKLFISVGENANGAHSQTLSNLLGKVLRINSDGTIPIDNPFYGTASGNNRAIWVRGLRNPFTFNFQPGTGRLFINDVGEGTWEEINDGIRGANFGWSLTEGAFNQGTYPTHSQPTFYYSSAGSGPTGSECAITGGTFYDPASALFPGSYVGRYFYSDYCAGWIRTINPPAEGVTLGTAGSSGFATGYNAPVGLEVGPDGALYVLTGANSGTGRVYRIFYSTSATPAISNDPAPVTVSVGNNAGFTVSASGAGPITYLWQRNSVNIAGTNAPSYTLTNAQLVDDGAVFRVIVSNASGAVTSNGATLTVTTNTPPSPVIVQPTAGTLFNAGQTITFSGTATDTQDGTMGAASFTWRVDLHHETHSHPAMAPAAGVTTGTFTVPNTGETSDDIWYRVYLTVTDSGGLSATVYRDIYPNKATLILNTNPSGLSITLDGQPATAPLTVISVVGMTRSIGTTSPQVGNPFVSWSDAGAIIHNITMPASTTTYTALFGPIPTPTPSSRVEFGNPNPNPAESLISFPLALPGPATVNLKVYTIAGLKVSDFGGSLASSGNFDWDLKDRWGNMVANGLYFARLEVEASTGKAVKIWKVLVLR